MTCFRLRVRRGHRHERRLRCDQLDSTKREIASDKSHDLLAFRRGAEGDDV